MKSAGFNHFPRTAPELLRWASDVVKLFTPDAETETRILTRPLVVVMALPLPARGAFLSGVGVEEAVEYDVAGMSRACRTSTTSYLGVPASDALTVFMRPGS
jgi:hypothetical protein